MNYTAGDIDACYAKTAIRVLRAQERPERPNRPHRLVRYQDGPASAGPIVAARLNDRPRRSAQLLPHSETSDVFKSVGPTTVIDGIEGVRRLPQRGIPSCVPPLGSVSQGRRHHVYRAKPRPR